MARYGWLGLTGLVLALFCGISLAQDEEKLPLEMELLMTADMDETAAKDGEEWFCLYKKGEECFVTPTIVKVERCYYHDVAGDSSGRTVSVPDIDGEVLFLFRGLENVKEGPIKTVFFGDKCFFPGESFTFSSENLGDNNRKKPRSEWYDWKVGAYGTASNVNFAGEIRHDRLYFNEYDMYVYSENKTQILCSTIDVEYDLYRPALLWAGDLDGDGKLDLYYDMEIYHYVTTHHELFLSSFADDDEFVKKAAIYHNTGR